MEYKINLEDSGLDIQKLAGVENKNLNYVEKNFDAAITLKDNELIIKSENDKAQRMIQLMIETLKKSPFLENTDLEYLREISRNNQEDRHSEIMEEVLTRTFSGKPIRPKTLGQKYLIDTFKKKDMIFAIGPAGTGKTYLGICYAVEQLKQNKVSKIILTRPAVEAGENLGFLPGDLKEKVDPYLRPLYDALDDMLSSERTVRYIEKGTIEIAPLAYMRGRTLEDAIVILDEAQNTTKAQMIMFLSRLGKNSKMIINGDLTQIDLPRNQISGLRMASEYLKDIEDIGFVELNHSDVVRHPLVIKILKAIQEKDQE